MASPVSGAEVENLNAFVARLHAIIDGIPYIDLKGLYAFLDALENPIPVTVLDDLVPPAACWILYAGFKLKYNDIGYPEEGYDNGEKRMPWSIGDLYGGPGGFNEKRWLFWKERFRALREQEVLKQKTK